MNFKEAYQKMLEGNKVRRKGDNGYFYYDENTKHVYHYISEKGFDNSTVNIEMEDALAEDWEVVEETKSKVKVWKPNKNEKYCYIGGDGDIYHTVNVNLTVDDCIFSIGNYFKTDEEAEHMVEKLKVIKELQDFAIENRDEEIVSTKSIPVSRYILCPECGNKINIENLDEHFYKKVDDNVIDISPLPTELIDKYFNISYGPKYNKCESCAYYQSIKNNDSARIVGDTPCTFCQNNLPMC